MRANFCVFINNSTASNLFSAPDEIIQDPLREYYELGLPDTKIAELLKDHYDTTEYGLRYVKFSNSYVHI